MQIVQLDEQGRLFLSPAIDDWALLDDHRIDAVIDLDGELDIGIPNTPNHTLYIYFPIYDEGLPNLQKLHAVARMGAHLIERGHRVLSHCGLGLNRSALMAGLILCYQGMSGPMVVELLRQKRPGALFNETFASYLQSMTHRPSKDLL